MSDSTTESMGESQTPTVLAIERTGDVAPVVKPLAWYQSILVRAARASLAAGGGLWAATGTDVIAFPAHDKWRIILQAMAASFCWSLAQNAGELLGRIDQTNPKLRG